jgi:hypothetical protein
LIDVHAYSAFLKAGKIANLVDALFPIYVCGLACMEFHAVSGHNATGSPY